jgi:hypothetical protein
MRIQPVNNGYYVSNLNNNRGLAQTGSVSFSGVNWDFKKLDVLKKTPSEIRDMARWFYKSSEAELREITGFHLFANRNRLAYNLLKTAVDAVNADKAKWQAELSLLDNTKATRALTEDEEKNEGRLKYQIQALDWLFDTRVDKFEVKPDKPATTYNGPKKESKYYTFSPEYMDREPIGTL